MAFTFLNLPSLTLIFLCQGTDSPLLAIVHGETGAVRWSGLSAQMLRLRKSTGVIGDGSKPNYFSTQHFYDFELDCDRRKILPNLMQFAESLESNPDQLCD